jgi:hypothetical protein
MRRIVFVLVVTALLVAILVFGGSAWAQVQPPEDKGCTGLDTADFIQKENPTNADEAHSNVKSVADQHRCKSH